MSCHRCTAASPGGARRPRQEPGRSRQGSIKALPMALLTAYEGLHARRPLPPPDRRLLHDRLCCGRPLRSHRRPGPGRRAGPREGDGMSADDAIGLLLALLVAGYLVVALVWPERF